ncbi:MAG: flagellar FliJ family protein [Spongiibacteraceae bacterium]|jgi:hypothetical protein|nr:flagellar FliJ family protein [Spongiibacteraceae bacterium]
MLERYFEQQQSLLDTLGGEHQKQRQLLERERGRLAALTELVRDLARPTSGSALYHLNRSAMRGQLSALLEMQQQETEMAELSYRHSFETMRRQLGRVKGLEELQAQRAAVVRARALRAEQRLLDEWSAAKWAVASD